MTQKSDDELGDALARFGQSHGDGDAFTAANAIYKAHYAHASQPLKDALDRFRPNGDAVVRRPGADEVNARFVVQRFVDEHPDEYPALLEFFHPKPPQGR